MQGEGGTGRVLIKNGHSTHVMLKSLGLAALSGTSLHNHVSRQE